MAMIFGGLGIVNTIIVQTGVLDAGKNKGMLSPRLMIKECRIAGEGDVDDYGEEKKLDTSGGSQQRKRDEEENEEQQPPYDIIAAPPSGGLAGGDQHVEDRSPSRRLPLPDMTGKIITVSTEETAELTKGPMMKKRDGGANEGSNCRPVEEIVAGQRQKQQQRRPSATAEVCNKLKQKEDACTDASVEEMEREFKQLIAKFASTPEVKGEEQSDDAPTIDDISTTKDGVFTEGGNRRRSMFNTECTPEASNVVRNYPQEVSMMALGGNDSTYGPTPTIDEDCTNDAVGERHRRSTWNISEYTLDTTEHCCTFDTTRKSESSLADLDVRSSRRKSENLLFEASEYTLDTTLYESSRDGAVNGECGDERGEQNIKGGSNGITEDNSAQQRGGISWASLINLDEERRKKKFNSARGKARENNSQRHTEREMSRERSSRRKGSGRDPFGNSCRDTYGSKRDRLWKASRGKSKDGSAAALHSTKTSSSSEKEDSEHIRKQATERFERGLQYAQRGHYKHSRERFLVALRYRVMRYGPSHPHVAAVHEMLGHVNYLLNEEVAEEEDFEASILDNDIGGGGGDMLGWDLPKNNDGSGKKRGRGRGMVYLEKAYKHYRTVLDILMVDDDQSSLVEEARKRPPAAANSDDAIKWFDIAESYNCLSDDEDSSPKLNTENLEEIVARVKDKLSLLPADVVAAKGGRSSYASGAPGTAFSLLEDCI